MRIGIIGAGMIGSTLAKLWADALHDVRIASRHPDALAPLVQSLGPRASAGTPVDAAKFGDVVMLSVPLKAVPELAREIAPLVSKKIVIDTGNAYANRDGDIAAKAARHPAGSAGWAAAMFPGARWVKAFNTLPASVLTRRRGHDPLLAEFVCTDLVDARLTASKLIRDLGFAPVFAGRADTAKYLETGGPLQMTEVNIQDATDVLAGVLGDYI